MLTQLGAGGVVQAMAVPTQSPPMQWSFSVHGSPSSQLAMVVVQP